MPGATICHSHRDPSSSLTPRSDISASGKLTRSYHLRIPYKTDVLLARSPRPSSKRLLFPPSLSSYRPCTPQHKQAKMKFALISLAFMAIVGTTCAQLTPCLEGCIATAEAEAGCSGYVGTSRPFRAVPSLPLLRSCHSPIQILRIGLTPLAGAGFSSGRLNIPCMCESSAFQADMLACLNAKCTPADLAAAKKFEAEFCGTCASSRFFVSANPSPVSLFSLFGGY